MADLEEQEGDELPAEPSGPDDPDAPDDKPQQPEKKDKGQKQEDDPSEPERERDSRDRALSNLHKREQALFKQQADLKEAQKELAEFKALKARAKYNPFALFEQINPEWKDREKFLEFVAETGGEVSAQDQRIMELEQRLNEKQKQEDEYREQQEAERLTQERKSQIDSAQQYIVKYVQDNAQHSKTLAAVPGAESQVYQVMQEHYDRTGEELPLEQAVGKASSRIESYLRGILKDATSSEHGIRIIEEVLSKSKPSRAVRVKGPGQSASNSTSRVASDAQLSPTEAFEQDLREAERRATLMQRRAQGV